LSERARLVATGLPAGAISTTESLELTEGWTLTSTDPGACAAPEDLSDDLKWQPAAVPGTVAVSVGPDDLDRHEDYDASDWWYRCRVLAPEGEGRVRLRFDGLATLAEVWLNGERVLDSSNMFCAYEVDVTDLVGDDNELALAFRSLGAALAERRPRPRWKTNLVDHQQLRWFRTTLLGRIPGWTPAIKPVGPWRSVWLERVAVAALESLDLRACVSGDDGIVELDAVLHASEGVEVASASLRVGDTEYELAAESSDGAWKVTGTARVSNPDRWWPVTHGEPVLHDCGLTLETSGGPISIDCGRVGFRELRLDTADGRIQFVVNDVPVFCRGACWTNNDIVSLVGSPERMRGILELTADANANMVRVGGTMVYETDDFYRTCDELGLMVWQDFMFANMDYPVDDEGFAESARAEADQQLRRISRHACSVAFCGGSEVEQQAAMFGAPRDIWTNEYFSKVLPELVERHAPGAPYWPSTPTGGALPFHVGEGLTHYYGVGAYKRPLDDVRLAGVRFTPECLGFSHVPEPENLRKLTPDGSVPPHHPAWKRGVPRDTGPGWDFEDIRDYYLGVTYGIDPVRLRSEDLERYLELSRVVTGEVLESVFAEWRRDENRCDGALTWFLNDLRPGAGWGLIDSDGEPKPVLHHLRRAWAPRTVRLLDRGLDGLVALVLNEMPEPLDGRLEFLVLGGSHSVITDAMEPLHLAPRGALEVPVEQAFGHFLDSTYSYRFGPVQHQAIVARLHMADRGVVSEDVYRPARFETSLSAPAEVRVRQETAGVLTVALQSDALLHDVRIDVRDYRADDNHFCLTPGRIRSISLRPLVESPRPFRGYLEATNLKEALRLPPPERGSRATGPGEAMQ
jgi:beta-mannosidase